MYLQIMTPHAHWQPRSVGKNANPNRFIGFRLSNLIQSIQVDSQQVAVDGYYLVP
jgi:hypothetical protein